MMINDETTKPDGFPEEFWGGFKRYVMHGLKPGSYLRAFFEGDLHEVCRRGGEDHLKKMWPMVMYLHNNCPPVCYGSFDRVQDWIDNGGLNGLNSKE